MKYELPEKCCKTCQHYIAHYIRTGRGTYSRLHCGHCTEPRLKDRKESTPACRHYSPKGENTTPGGP